MGKFITTKFSEFINEKSIKNNNNSLVNFSPAFYKQDDDMIKYCSKIYLKKIDDFINFYKKYDTKGIRIIDGRDVYEESKAVYDKIISGEIYIDSVFLNPDNPLRNVALLQHLDEAELVYKLSNKK